MTAKRTFDPEFLQDVINQYAAHSNNLQDLANHFEVARTTIRGWLQRAQREGYTPQAEAAHPRDRENLALTEQVKALKTELRTVSRDNLSAEIVRQTILGLSEQIASPPDWVLNTVKRKHSQLVPSVMWSDWHWGEVVNPAEVGHINSFDLATAHTRAKVLTEKVISLCFDHMVDPDYPGIVVNLGGDMVSGDIHAELTSTNELPIMPIIIDIVGVLIESLTHLADRFGRVFVPCVAGNHGRNTFKPRMKQRAHTNFDWLIYSFLEVHFQGDKRFTFMVPEGTDCYYRVYNHKYLLTHGDTLGVRGGDGIIGSLGPILRGDFKTRRQSGELGQPYDTLIIGHWHQYMALVPKLIVNGSLKGFDEFAKTGLRASPEGPTQALWFTSPDHGIVSSWPIFLNEAQKVPQESWVTIPE